MEKPFILIQNDMREELTTLVNKYTKDVPIVNIIDALSNMVTAMTPFAENQLKQAREQYEKEKKENKDEQ